MDYACSVWNNTKKGNIDKLQRTLYQAILITSILEVLIYCVPWDGLRFKKGVITSQLSWCISPFMY